MAFTRIKSPWGYVSLILFAFTSPSVLPNHIRLLHFSAAKIPSEKGGLLQTATVVPALASEGELTGPARTPFHVTGFIA